MDSAHFFGGNKRNIGAKHVKFCMEIVLRILHSVFLQVDYLIDASMRDFDVTSGRMQLLYIQRSRHTAVRIITRLWAGRPRFQFLTVVYRGGSLGCSNPLPPEIPKISVESSIA